LPNGKKFYDNILVYMILITCYNLLSAITALMLLVGRQEGLLPIKYVRPHASVCTRSVEMRRQMWRMHVHGRCMIAPRPTCLLKL